MMPPHVLLRFGALGDVLLAVAAARWLRRDDRPLLWVLGSRLRPLAPYLPADHVRVLSGPAGLLPLAAWLRRQRPAACFDLQGKLASLLLTAALGVPGGRYGKRPLTETWQAARGRFPLRPSDRRPVWRRYLDTVGAPSDAPADGRLDLPPALRAEGLSWLASTGLRPGRFLLLHPGATHPGKQLPAAAAALTGPLARACEMPLLLLGDRPEPAWPGQEAALDLRGRVPLHLLPVVVRAAAGLISSDSGPLHLAAAVGIPSIGIYLQTDPCLGFTPVPPTPSLVLSRALPCKPCHLHGARRACPLGHWDCRRLDWAGLLEETIAFLRPHLAGREERR